MADLKCKKWVDGVENCYKGVFWVAGYEFGVKIQNSKCRIENGWSKMWKTARWAWKLVQGGFFGLLVTNLQWKNKFKMADRKCNKWVDGVKICYKGVYWVAGCEFAVKIQKLKIADSRWRTGNVKNESIGLNITTRVFFWVVGYEFVVKIKKNINCNLKRKEVNKILMKGNRPGWDELKNIRKINKKTK